MPTKFAVFVVLLLGQVACAPKTVLTAEMQPRTIKALNLEETLSQRDEVMLAYALTAYDANNRAVSVVNGGWGVSSVRKNEEIALAQKAQPLQLNVPKNGRVVASVVLIEVDDAGQAQTMLNQIRQIHNVVSVPAGLLLTATEVLTPLKYITIGLTAAGLGVKLVDQFNDDDLLGQSSAELNEKDLVSGTTTSRTISANLTGTNLRDTYAYQLQYDVRLKRVKMTVARR
ncbi:hypothetical protein F5984_19730 [Rudanella paleaurantiibacter]|uniref:Uncharacterized protein n=1 Tax=Rudanella paleaurantiibacter TaxID=2614655 RepID=A0A7J5TV06_9BACT|nr:hypothetical protein [Rudanella paleaurantiibacter]KAB7727988.1 hypothetical protein F5984_19730 [Rudanella paleaurantiibacter]